MNDEIKTGEELKRVADWLRSFKSDTEIWKVAWRLLKTTEMLRKALFRADRTCENMHHDKKERHEGSNCPVETWVNDAIDNPHLK